VTTKKTQAPTDLIESLTLDELDELLSLYDVKSMKALTDKGEVKLLKGVLFMLRRRDDPALTFEAIGSVTFAELATLLA
jgi:hypothetical protein